MMPGPITFATRFICVTVLGLLLQSCTSLEQRPDGAAAAIDAALAEVMETLETTVRPDPSVTQALLPPVDYGLPSGLASILVEERVDVSVSDAEARSFFMTLVAGTPWNMVVHPDVEGRISLVLRNVTIPEVMSTVYQVYGYPYRESAAGFVVLPRSIQTRIFLVDYLNVVRSGTSSTQVSSGQVSQGSASPFGGASAGFPGASAVVSNFQGGDGEILGARVRTESESDFWSGLEESVLVLIGPGEGRSVVVNRSAGVVAVRAMSDELASVALFLRSVQQSVERQVILEAKIIEVRLDEEFRSGINWSYLLASSNNDTVTVGMTGGPDLFIGGGSTLSGTPIVVAPGNPVDGFTTTAFGGVFSLAVDTPSFNGFIELLEAQGETRVLSSPRIATINNQKAIIKVGSDEFFVTGVTSTTTSGVSTSTNQNVVLTPFFSGIALDVTPQINREGDIILHIHLTVSEVSDQLKEFTISGLEQSLPLAFSQVRESDSIVRARSNQIIVIGGLMRAEDITQSAGVPWLARIPLVGSLFSNQRQRRVMTELVILLRPVVVETDQDWNDVLNPTRARWTDPSVQFD